MRADAARARALRFAAPDYRRTPEPSGGIDRTEENAMSKTRATSTAPHDSQSIWRQCALTLSLVAATALAGCATAHGGVTSRGYAEVEIVDRIDGRVLPVYRKDGQAWVVGTPGREYAVRIRSINGGRLLAVTSVDGVNVISGETASPAQSGYVLDPYSSLDIAGWRKNLARTAAFYFTELPDSYAARTGRPDHVGVIGVAVFRERVPPVLGKIGPSRADERDGANAPAAYPPAASARREAAAGDAAAGGVTSESKAEEAVSPDVRGRQDAQRSLPASPLYAPVPAAPPAAKLGTGHGRNETSHAQMVAFERDSSQPAEVITIRYDRRENLIAMGVLPPPVAHVPPRPTPFPAWPRFAPDPPR
jgi:hypothetical protein